MPKETHGIYKWIKQNQLPSARGIDKVKKCLDELEQGLIQDYGGPGKISTSQEILIRSVVKALGVQFLAELFINEYGPIRKRGNDIELRALLGKNYLSFINSIRQNLLALKELSKDAKGDAPDLIEYVEKKYGKPNKVKKDESK